MFSKVLFCLHQIGCFSMFQLRIFLLQSGKTIIYAFFIVGYFGQNIQPTALQINTANQLLLVNGEKSPPTSTTANQIFMVNGRKSPPNSTAKHLLMVNGQKSPPTANILNPPSPKSPKPPTPTHIISPPPGNGLLFYF